MLLAAGAGRRMGRPKALLRDDQDVPWLLRGADVLRAGGCTEVVVVLGAEAERARSLLESTGTAPGAEATVVVAPDWEEGMGASLRCGLEAARATRAEAALVLLVDLPDVDAEVVRRFTGNADTGSLARATYAGRPGHPVLLGRDHWAGVAASAVGDRGARAYLDEHEVLGVPCEDLATGRDRDRPGDLGTRLEE